MKLVHVGGAHTRFSQIRRHVFGTALAFAVLFLGVALPSRSAYAINPVHCDDDAVTETPSFAMGRDSSQCLLIDPGNGDAPVKFQWEIFHKSGLMTTALDSGENPSVEIMDIVHKEACVGSETCSFLMWDSVADNYSDKASKNDDVMFLGQGQRNEYTLIKDSIIANGMKCAGGTGWSGPNGLSCASGEDSAAHSDGLQLRGQPVNNGWFILQDTIFVNGFNLQLIDQVSSELGRTGSFVIQGGEIGRRQSVGQAVTWIDDCEARRDQSISNGSDICPKGRAIIDNDTREVWFIDVSGETEINAKGTHEKVVVVNSGCNSAGCNGTVGYDNGWPHPLQGISTKGPGNCPNGQITSFNGNPTYCYTSLEHARLDHKLPPFVQLSSSGWESAPSSATASRPNPPNLLQ
jgi:hypothetical protein